MEGPIVIPNPVGKVNSRLDLLPVVLGQRRPQDGVGVVVFVLPSEPDVGGRAGEALAAPLEGAFCDVSFGWLD